MEQLFYNVLGKLIASFILFIVSYMTNKFWKKKKKKAFLIKIISPIFIISFPPAISRIDCKISFYTLTILQSENITIIVLTTIDCYILNI